MMILSLVLISAPDMIKGVVSGAMCGIHEMKCEHKPGAHGYETLGIFVDGKGFFYFANVPQQVLRRINRMEISVKGEVKPKYRSIVAHVIKAGDKVVWVWKKEMKEKKHDHDKSNHPKGKGRK